MTEASKTAAYANEKSGAPAAFKTFTQNREVRRFAKFFVVGAIGAVIDGSTFNGLNAAGWLSFIEVRFPFGFTLTGLGASGTIAFLMAVISNFIWNRYWVYPDSRSKALGSQLGSFFLVSILGIVIRIPILELLHKPLTALWGQWLPIQSPLTPQFLGENSAWALSVMAVMLWNFFVNRYWTYNDVK